MEYEADKRSYRVLKLFETFQKLGHGAVLDKKEFAEEMGVSERSVQRDIRTINGYLSDCGNSSEIVYDRQRNGYRLCQEDTRFLDKGEILAVCKILIESRAFSKAELKSLLNRLLHSMISKDTQKEIENYINQKQAEIKKENSSSDIANEMVNVIQYQKAFSMNAKMVQTADELEKLINNLR